MPALYRRAIESVRRLEDRLTVRQQIGIAVAALCVAVVAAVTVSATLLGQKQAEAQVNEEMGRLASAMAERADRYMYLRHREMRLITEMTALRRLWGGDPAELRRVLDHLQKTIADYTWIGFATPDGIVKAATKGMVEGASVKTRPWFKNGLSGATTEDVHEAKLLSTLLGANSHGEPFRFVDVAMPVISADGVLLGVLGAHFSWTWADDLRRSMIGRTQGSEHIEIWIVSANGSILLGPQMPQTAFSLERLASMQTSKRGTFVDTVNDTPVLTGYAVTDGELDYPGLGWTILARTPRAVALADANASFWTIAGFGTATALLGLALAIWIAGRVSRPIQRLKQAADQLGRSERAMMIPRLRGSLDVVNLSGALRSLIRRLGTAEQRGDAAELMASENAEQYVHDVKALRHLANTDPLTGLLNRRAFNGVADDAMDYFKRYARSVAILIVDIDHFKRVNDTYGHAAGDAVIKRIGELITQTIRSTDKVARFGGEEFVILLREADDASSRYLADRIREIVAADKIPCGELSISVTVSIGGSTATEADRDIQDVTQRADLGLYVAKNGGRNRTSIVPPPAAVPTALAA